MVSLKKLLIAASILLGEVVAAPHSSGELDTTGVKVRTVSDLVLASRDLQDTAVVNINIDRSKEKRGGASKSHSGTSKKTKSKSSTPKKKKTDTLDKTPVKHAPAGADGTACAYKPKKKLTRRDGLKRASNKDDIDENEYVMAVRKGEEASVTNLSGCTAVFFWDYNKVPSIFHIFCGSESTLAADAIDRVLDFGIDPVSVSVVAAKESRRTRAEEAIASVYPGIQFIDEPLYDESKTKTKSDGSIGDRYVLTVVSGSRKIHRSLQRGCSKQQQRQRGQSSRQGQSSRHT